MALDRFSRLETQCRSQLIRDEGRSKVIYYDTLNVPTIGVGRNLNRGLSNDEIDLLFSHDFHTHLNKLCDALPWVEALDDVRLGALVNMAFNLGIPQLLKFKNMFGALKAGQWAEAAAHAKNSVWASRVGIRAERIAKQFRTGLWQ